MDLVVKPKVAIMYDFDKTLTTRDMQEYSFMPNLGLDAKTFWGKADETARKNGMDKILAYMKLMLDESRNKDKPIRRSDFVVLGKELEFYPGVTEWFGHVNKLGTKLGLEIEHYIISSGLKEIIEGSVISKKFKRIYACEYYYDASGVAVWPKLAVNYTAKTQFLFRINKGVLDVFEDEDLNAYTPESERSIPFSNMIYIGDGLTDVPCMKLVKENGGSSIAVHAPNQDTVARRLMHENRINFFTLADYSADGELFALLTTILEKIKASMKLEQYRRQMEKGCE